MIKRPLTMIIMDGFGLGIPDSHNAIHVAKTPVLDRLRAQWPNTTIAASGEDVGLPVGQIGNSEVGHMHIGAGRVIYQDLSMILDQISDGRFYTNKAYVGAMDHCLQNGTSLHLIGLLSDGGVHSHITHLKALIEMAKKQGLENVYVHCFMDGRDVPPTSGLGFVKELEAYMKEIGLVMNLKDLGVTEEMLDGITDSTFIMDGGYKAMSHDDVRRVLEKSMG